MRETKLGRWVVRVACAMGVSAAVLGLPVVAYADVTPAGAVFYQVPGQVGLVGTVDGTKTTTAYTTNDVVWT